MNLDRGKLKNPKISFVIPLYNESETIPHLVKRLNAVLDKLQLSTEVVLVDDGSRDNTKDLIHQIALSDDRYQSVFLARNYGHQIALSAGLSVAHATEAVMILDGDLQDPPELFPKFYEYFLEGYDVVYGIGKRKENMFIKFGYLIFYRFLKFISYIEIPLDSGDYSLVSRRVVDILNKMTEESRYIRGMRFWIGFNQIGLEYEREKRVAGSSKYSLKALFKLAYNGIFNFSEVPIKFITKMGIFSLLISLIYFLITLIKKFFFGDVPQGFTALLFSIILFGGVQLISLGVIGEYILRIFFQVKNRPLYIIKNRIIKKEVLRE